MSIENLDNQEFKTLMQENIFDMIEYMFNNNQEFGIACEIKEIGFTPELPESIMEAFPEITLFMLANYAFESSSLNEDFISFETGFGENNIGAIVNIPLLAIKQIFVDQYPILINISSFSNEDIEEVEALDSMAALLNNPENAKLLKKNKR